MTAEADVQPAPTFFERARDAEAADHAAHQAAEYAEARRRLRRRPLRQPWVSRYTRDKATSEIVTRPGKENRHRDEVTVDRDGEVVGHGCDPLRPEYIARGYHIDRQRKRPWVVGKSRIRPGDEDDRVLNLIWEVFNLYSPWDGEGEEPIMQPVPAAHFRTAAAKADPPIIWLTVQRRAFEHLGVKSTPIPGMSAGKMWTLPADHGPNRAPGSDVWPDGKGGWTTTPPLDDGAE